MAEKGNLIKTMALAANMRLDALPPELKWQGAAGAKLWGSIADAGEKGEPICWNSYCNAPEIFYAMGLPVIMQEALGAASVSLPGKLNEKYIDIAQENLVADHVCSTQKIMMGAALCGDLPPPTTIVHSGQPCDSTMVTYSTIAHYLGVPHFTLDIPNRKDERTVQYVADELERMVAFLEEHTGKKLEDEKIREVMEYSNTAFEYNLKLNELSKMVPCPLRSPPGMGLLLSAGTPECAEHYRKLYEMGKAVVESGEGYPDNQRLRVAWFSTGTASVPDLYDWVHKEFGAFGVNTMIGTNTTPPTQDISSRRKIMEALARELRNIPMNRECWGSLEDWLDYAIPTCRDYKLDALILTIHIGCKNMWAMIKLAKDKIAEEVGIPTLVVEADIADARTFSGEDQKAQISDFFNTIMA